MKETGLIYNDEMVLATIEERKWQTRRLVKPQPFLDPAWGWTFEPRGKRPHAPSYVERNVNWNPISNAILHYWKDRGGSPYGQTGDRLWVRETWGLRRYTDSTDWRRGSIKGVSELDLLKQYKLEYASEWGPNQECCYWRPSILMPRWASRLTLEITSVRVERLHDISEEDAKAEGVESGIWDGESGVLAGAVDPEDEERLSFRDGFAFLWESLYGSESWAANPWVWVIGFKLLKGKG